MEETGKKTGKTGGEKEIKTFLVATKVVASQPPEPTGTPTARADFWVSSIHYLA